MKHLLNYYLSICFELHFNLLLYSIANVAFMQKNHRSHFLWNKPAFIIAFCGMTCEYGCVLMLAAKKSTEEEESSPAFEEEFVEGADR